VCTRAPQCSPTDPCPAGQLCTAGTCGAPPPTGCSDANPCPAGQVCNNGSCGKVMPGGGKCPPGVTTAPTPDGGDMYLDTAHQGVAGCCMPCEKGTWPYALKNPSDPVDPGRRMWFCFKDPATEVRDPLCCDGAGTAAPGGSGGGCGSPPTAGTAPNCPATKLCAGVAPGSY